MWVASSSCAIRYPDGLSRQPPALESQGHRGPNLGTSPRKDRRRFGIGEWYGRLFTNLAPDERMSYAEAQFRTQRPSYACPFQSTPLGPAPCSKAGGVCTLRQYVQTANSGQATPANGSEGTLRTVCPKRFEEGGTVFRWVGETLLSCTNPAVIHEVGFLSSLSDGDDGSDDVGRIDEVLVVPDSEPLSWCALEVQAVYFQGSGMAGEFRAIVEDGGSQVLFPVGLRRPDYRSSGPKRLMPQLQIKVPSLRRWGRKMAVVVDRSFFAALAPMDRVRHVSNCDIAWFVVGYEERDGRAVLVPHDVYLTTLERAVEGLTAGVPVSLDVFENRIREKLAKAGHQTAR